MKNTCFVANFSCTTWFWKEKVHAMTRVAFHLPDAPFVSRKARQAIRSPLQNKVTGPTGGGWTSQTLRNTAEKTPLFWRVRWFFRISLGQKKFTKMCYSHFCWGAGYFLKPNNFPPLFPVNVPWVFGGNNPPLLFTTILGGIPNRRFGRRNLPPPHATSAWERILKPQSFGSAAAQMPAGWPQPQWKSFWWLFLRPELIEKGCYVQLSLQKK